VTAPLVDVRTAGAVRTLTLDSPHNRNALSAALLDQLAEGLHTAVADDAVRVIVLTGTGPVFCSGADLSEAVDGGTGPPGGPSRMPEVLTAITSARIPVIARVNGHARAGGLGLIAAADLAVAPAASTFAYSEVRVGVAPAMVLVPTLPLVDRRFLSRATLTGETFTAAEAARAGLLTDVVSAEVTGDHSGDPASALDAWVRVAVTSLLAGAPGALAATKHLLATLPAAPTFADGLAAAAARSAELFAGAEAAEGMAAFLQKRPPGWVAVP
jgi:enoyl-CoA hydratase/carnithine racemase